MTKSIKLSPSTWHIQFTWEASVLSFLSLPLLHALNDNVFTPVHPHLEISIFQSLITNPNFYRAHHVQVPAFLLPFLQVTIFLNIKILQFQKAFNEFFTHAETQSSQFQVLLLPRATQGFFTPTSCVFHMNFHYSTCRQPAKAILLFRRDTDSIFLHKFSSKYQFPFFSKFQKIQSCLFFLISNILLFKREFGIEKYEQYSTSYNTKITATLGHNLLSKHVKMVILYVLNLLLYFPYQ